MPPSEKTTETGAAAPLEVWLRELLACPVDGGSLRADHDVLVCTSCGRRYPVRDGIPVMLPEDAEPEQRF